MTISTCTTPDDDADKGLSTSALIQAYKEFERKVAVTPDTIRCNSHAIDRLRTQLKPSETMGNLPESLFGVHIETMDALPDGIMLAGRYAMEGGRVVFKPMQIFKHVADGKWVEYDWDALMALLG